MPTFITADGVFISGNEAVITPVINLDGISIGRGKDGKITKKLRGK